jgi:hypothetical protein
MPSTLSAADTGGRLSKVKATEPVAPERPDFPIGFALSQSTVLGKTVEPLATPFSPRPTDGTQLAAGITGGLKVTAEMPTALASGVTVSDTGEDVLPL